MNCKKTAVNSLCAGIPDADLEAINRFARSPLTAEEVYTFSLRLCDNEVDRDFERFSADALATLSQLFVGKTGLFDHQWSAAGQSARIYRTEVVADEGLTTSAGEAYRYLKAWAYMIRTEDNAALIREIEAGIKKEVSVSCAVESTICSLCGEPLGSPECSHTKGRWYDGILCCGILTQPTDAYEWSFVAVPAQPKAGVVKGFSAPAGSTLMDYVAPHPDLAAQLTALEQEAELGRRYLSALRGEVVRLGGLVRDGMDTALRKSMTEKLSEEELLALKQGYETRLESEYPPVSQLTRKVPELSAPKADEFFRI